MTSIEGTQKEPLIDFPKEGVALVIGGSGGIGRAIAESLAGYGSSCVISYRSNSERAREVVAHLNDRCDPGARAYQLDVSNADAVTSTISEVIQRHGDIHTLVYASGPHVHLKYLSQIEPSEMRSYFEQDTLGYFHVCSSTLPSLRKTRGSIVACHTAGSKRWPPRDGLSVVPKAGVDALTIGIAREEGRYGVRANSVAIGTVEAGMHIRSVDSGEFDKAYLTAAIGSTALKRAGGAEDVAEVVSFLASTRAKFITGQTLCVDGGYSL